MWAPVTNPAEPAGDHHHPVLTPNDDNNDVVFRCNDPDSGCLALTEDVSDVLCYCQQGGNLVPNNVPCVRGQSPYHQLPVVQLFFLFQMFL